MIQKTIDTVIPFVKNISRKKILIIACCVLIVGGVVFIQQKNKTRDPESEARRQTQELVAVVNRIMELPTDEVPTVANIIDREKLSGQTFFAKAQNGDKLLAYTKNRIAILYRPSTNKIINVAPISDQSPHVSANTTTERTQKNTAGHKHTVTYYNGTKTVGVASEAEKKVNDTYKDYKTHAVTNASRKDYVGTLVVNISGTHKEEAAELAELLKGKVGVLPEGEIAPDSDLLVISGK